MSDQNRLMKWVLVIVLVGLAMLTLYPPSETLKAGIDLAGGSALLFEIDTTGLDPDQIPQLSTRVMNVLKDRVDPKGQLNLEWRPIGNTRLEIRMPRPSKAALERREAKDAILDAIQAKNLERYDVERALSDKTPNRVAMLAALVRGIEERTELVAALKTAYDARESLKGSDDAEATDQAVTAYEQAMTALLATNLSQNRLLDVLAIEKTLRRDEELAKLRAAFPSFDKSRADGADAGLITQMVTAFDEWSHDKAELEDPSDLKRRLKGAGVLEFRILAERDSGSPTNIRDPKLRGSRSIAKYTEQLAKRGPRPMPGDEVAWYAIAEPLKFLRADSVEQLELNKDQPGRPVVEEYAGKYYVLAYDVPRNAMLKGGGDRKWKLTGAYSDRDPYTGEHVVVFTLDARGGTLFGELTGANVENPLCIMLDNQAVSYANIVERITQTCQIKGSFTVERVQDLVRTLDAGSLPARLMDTPLSEKTIGPSLGETNRRMGTQAAIGAAIAVAVFVLLYYGIAAGGMANLALAMNMLLVLGVMALLQATFTLPGIAGLILTVGMAIDANVLIFERIREERKRGIVFKKALNAGYDKAFSTIIDANLTTLLTCIILGFVGSEEVKGFAITLGVGIVTSMFTSLFVTRLAFNTLVSAGILKDLRLRSIIGVPNVDWLALRAKFWPVSLVMVVVGGGVFITLANTNTEAVFDIEFLGGTSVQIDLKQGESMTDEEVTAHITGDKLKEGVSSVAWLDQAAQSLRESTPAQGSRARLFTLTAPEGTLSGEQLGILMRARLKKEIETDGATVLDKRSIEFEMKSAKYTLDQFKAVVAAAADDTDSAAEHLKSARVQTVKDIQAEEGGPPSFEVVTIETNRALVEEAILAALGSKLKLQRAVAFEPVQDTDLLNEPFFVVEDSDHYLGDVIGGDWPYDVRRYHGGVAIHIKLAADAEPITKAELATRIKEVGLHAATEEHVIRQSEIFPLGAAVAAGPAGAADAYREFAIVAKDEESLYGDVEEDVWKDALARPQLEVVRAALTSEKSLTKVVQFEAQVAGQARNNAVFAIILALAAIVAYLWLRFGTKEYGLAAIVALVHDVSVTLGLVVTSRFVAGTIFGDALLLDAFRVDLPMIAAVLTVIGYSLNDTIVVFDRIRENRGKIGKLSATLINTSINQTLSRTLLTSVTTFLAVIILYIFGGTGVHGFSFALAIGVVVGTYSSVGIATPLLFRPQLLRDVVTVLVALVLVGLTCLATDNITVEAVVSGVIVLVFAFLIAKARGGRPSSPSGGAGAARGRAVTA